MRIAERKRGDGLGICRTHLSFERRTSGRGGALQRRDERIAGGTVLEMEPGRLPAMSAFEGGTACQREGELNDD